MKSSHLSALGVVSFFFLIFIYLFGCVRSQLQRVGSFAVTGGLLSSWGRQAWLLCSM